MFDNVVTELQSNLVNLNTVHVQVLWQDDHNDTEYCSLFATFRQLELDSLGLWFVRRLRSNLRASN